MQRIFKYKDKEIVSGEETILCGIVNVTPDSFSDGGKWFGVEKAVEHAKDLIRDGAKMLDIGGESTRPGSTPVEAEEEIRRVIPVIKELKKITDIPLSVDTWKAEVAKAAIEAGVDIVNDITGFLGDPKMAEVVGASDVGVILMYDAVVSRPDHPSSKIFPGFGGKDAFTDEEKKIMSSMPIDEAMIYYLRKSIKIANDNGISNDRIMLDPGIGFGLTKKENLMLIKNLSRIHDMGFQAFVGVSRKRFIVNILEELGFNINPETEEGHENRDDGSAALTAIASLMGAEVVRVHTIKKHLMSASIGDSVRLAAKADDINFKSYKEKAMIG